MHSKEMRKVPQWASMAEEWRDELTDEYRRDLRAKASDDWGNLDIFASLPKPAPARTRQLLPPPLFADRRPFPSAQRVLPRPDPLPAFALTTEPAPAIARTIPPPPFPSAPFHPRFGTKGPLIAVILAAVAAVAFLRSRPGKVVMVAAGHGGELLPNAEMVIDGKEKCSGARCTFETATGVHEVTVRAEGYLPQLQVIALGSGEAAAMNFRLERGGSSLDIAGHPEGASLIVDGRWFGSLPLRVDLSPGAHHVRVEADRFLPDERIVELKVGETKRVRDVALLPRIGRSSPLSSE